MSVERCSAAKCFIKDVENLVISARFVCQMSGSFTLNVHPAVTLYTSSLALMLKWRRCRAVTKANGSWRKTRATGCQERTSVTRSALLIHIFLALPDNALSSPKTLVIRIGWSMNASKTYRCPSLSTATKQQAIYRSALRTRISVARLSSCHVLASPPRRGAPRFPRSLRKLTLPPLASPQSPVQRAPPAAHPSTGDRHVRDLTIFRG